MVGGVQKQRMGGWLMTVRKGNQVSSGAAAWLQGRRKGGSGPTQGPGLSRRALGCSSVLALLEGFDA